MIFLFMGALAVFGSGFVTVSVKPVLKLAIHKEVIKQGVADYSTLNGKK